MSVTIFFFRQVCMATGETNMFASSCEILLGRDVVRVCMQEVGFPPTLTRKVAELCVGIMPFL